MLWRSRFHTTSVMSVLTSKEPHICKRAPYPQDSSAPRPLLHSSRTHWTWIYHHRHGDPEHWHDSSWPAAHSPSKKQMTTLCNTPSTPLLGAESGKRLQRGCGNGTRWQIYYGIVWIVLVMAHMLFLQKIFQNLKPRCSGSMGKFSNLATSCHVQHMLIDEDGTMNWAGHVELDWRVHSEYLMSHEQCLCKMYCSITKHMFGMWQNLMQWVGCRWQSGHQTRIFKPDLWTNWWCWYRQFRQQPFVSLTVHELTVLSPWLTVWYLQVANLFINTTNNGTTLPSPQKYG